MSQENVEIVRQAYELEARREFVALHAMYDPEIEMEFSDSPFGDFAEPVAHGLDEVKKTFRDFYAAFGDVTSEVHELIEAGEDQVISVFTYRGTGRASGVKAEWKHMAGLWTIREGKVTHVAWLQSRERAREAVGLSSP